MGTSTINPAVRLSGNPCLLALFEHEPSEPPQRTSEVTRCESWPIQGQGESVFAVRCYNGNQLIACCGHGLLSAASYWQRQLDLKNISLKMGNSVIESWGDAEITWLSFETISTFLCPLPEWLQQVFPAQVQPIAAATAGDDNGYLVLQWPDNFPLAQLSLPKDCLGQHSQRALVCTAAQPALGENTIELRYFAPQYGIVEDTATGSAMRILSHFWSLRFGALIATQCSPAGGQLFSSFKGSRVEVGGRCVATSIPDQSSTEASHE